MVGSVRDRAVALLQTLSPDLGLDQVLEAIRTLDEGHRASSGELEPQGSEPRFRLSFESSGLGIALVDVTGRLIRGNRALAAPP